MKNKKTIVCIAALDTKGHEIQYIKDIINARGHRTIVIDSGTLGDPIITPDVSREEVLKAANSSLEKIVNCSEDEASQIILPGLIMIVQSIYDSGQLDGIISIGGGMGSNLASTVMRELPVGLPKFLVSTMIGKGGAQGYVGTKDITIMPSVADIEGLNRITKKILSNAAGAICGMVEMRDTVSITPSSKYLVAMSMVGPVTECGLRVKSALEKKGGEVVVFHAIGVGGRALEEFVSNEPVTGTIELALCEITSELFGGFASSGPNRLEAAGIKGIPQIITPGHVGRLSFLGPDTVPKKYRKRNIVFHNPQATSVQINADELALVAGTIAEKLNRATGTVKVLIPLRGFSAWDKEGKEAYNPEYNESFVKNLREKLKTSIKLHEIDAHINDVKFSNAILEEFLQSVK